MGILPPRPLRLDPIALTRRARRHVLMAGLILAVAAGMCAGCAWLGREILRERALWRSGVPGRVLSLRGKLQSTDFLFNDYDLEVLWADAGGRQRSGKTSFLITGMKVDAQSVPGLRYDPADPSRIVLSWAGESGVPRAALPLLLGAFGLFLLFAFPFHLREERRKLELLRLCAEDGEEVLPQLVGLTVYKGIWSIRYRMPDDLAVRKASAREAPLVLQRNGEQRLLGLRSPRAPERIYLAQADLKPFDFSDEERTRIAAG